MREIKFRVWNKSKKQFVPENSCDEYGVLQDGTIFYIEHETGSGDVITDEKREFWEIQQYTGLKDKNGVEIYEGDILREQNKFGETFSIVEFHSASFAVRYLKGATQRNLVGFFNDCNGPISEHLEVIGNIF